MTRSFAIRYEEAVDRLAACPFEMGVMGALADNECEHGNLPTRRHPNPTCGCWQREQGASRMRDEQQRLAALEKANQVRLAQFAEKERVRQLHASEVREELARMLEQPPHPALRRVPVARVLMWGKTIGYAKAEAWLKYAQVGLTARWGGLTDRQRVELASVLRDRSYGGHDGRLEDAA